MSYDICRICGRFFNRNGNTLCEECYEKDRLQYEKVREYVENHHNATVIDIINATSVTLKTIMRFVEEGAFTYINDKIELE
ncbi:hypothetical protein SDC9_204415 [bioreactor metagenome]|uniref:Flagellar operon protein TIGR03826 n=1 Tax=bioreactor metagenome TaxID=1076179 RepID=A0A645JB39_9ZZZZ